MRATLLVGLAACGAAPAPAPMVPPEVLGNAAPAPRPVVITVDELVRAPVAGDLERYLEMVPGDGDDVVATIATSEGTLTCLLMPDLAPLTVANFIGLALGAKPWRARDGGEVQRGVPLYDGGTFHRVIPQFMIQGGDPQGTGKGGPGYTFADELDGDLLHVPGMLAMANRGPDTNGSQFFIDDARNAHLDGKHTIFGACEPVEVVSRIAGVPTDPGGRPHTPVVIERVEVARRPAP